MRFQLYCTVVISELIRDQDRDLVTGIAFETARATGWHHARAKPPVSRRGALRSCRAIGKARRVDFDGTACSVLYYILYMYTVVSTDHVRAILTQTSELSVSHANTRKTAVLCKRRATAVTADSDMRGVHVDVRATLALSKHKQAKVYTNVVS